MSSWLCSPEHIGRLTSFFCSDRNHRTEDPAAIATLLAKGNLHGVGYRYDQSDDQVAQGRGFKDADAYIAAAVTDARRPLPRLPIVELLKHVACLNYQSCDPDDWEASDACRVLQRIQDAAIGQLPGWDTASWGYEAPRPEGLKVMK